MMKRVRSSCGLDSRAKGKYRATEYNAELLLVALVQSIIDKKITKIRNIGIFKYDENKKVTGFVPYNNLLNRLNGKNTKNNMTKPRLASKELNYLKAQTGLMDDDIYLTIASLNTYIMLELRAHQTVTMPNVGTISVNIIAPINEGDLAQVDFMFEAA